jgi:hypothetical protein
MGKSYQARKKVLGQIEKYRKGRVPICFFNFDRRSLPQNVIGLTTAFASDTKEIIYRLLRDSEQGKGFDLILYTRGGDLNSVWPIISLIREFDPCFEVLVPFRCHSSGTLLALGARKIHMTKLGELSPIDPSTHNAFNPVTKDGAKIQISVEDVTSYFDLVKSRNGETNEFSAFDSLSKANVHPLALGNVHRVYLQTRQLAEKLLKTNQCNKKGRKGDKHAIVEKLSTGFYSHNHTISRVEAKELLGPDHLCFTDDKLEALLDSLLKTYEDNFKLREQYILADDIKGAKEKKVAYYGAIIESQLRSYIHKSEGTWYKRTLPPKGVNINLQPGMDMPDVPGWPKSYEYEPVFQDWTFNGEKT